MSRGAAQISWNQTGTAGVSGTNGTNGMNGTNGTNGASAYDVWLGLGNIGTEQDFIDSVRGPAGSDGEDGTLALAGQTCPQGQSVTGFDQSGNIACGQVIAPPSDRGEDCHPLNASLALTSTTAT